MSSNENKLSVKRDINWFSVIINIQMLISFIIGCHFILYEAYWKTIIFSLGLILLGQLGMTAGAHRLWAHKSYKATTSLRLFLMFCNTIAGQNSIYNWVRLHRLHHKHFKTDLDPYDYRKGFFHSHVVANVRKLSPAQDEQLAEVDMSDLENDKIVMFQKKYYWVLFLSSTILLVWNTPLEFWGEDTLTAFFVVLLFRMFINYQLSSLIYSSINIFDIDDAYREYLNSNLVFFIDKTYWISYHYLAPWDYQSSEHGAYGTDCTSKFIRVCAALEYAGDLRTPDSRMIRQALEDHVEKKQSFEKSLHELEDQLSEKLSDKIYLTPVKFY